MSYVRSAAIALASAEIWIVTLMVGGSVAMSRLLPAAVAVAALFWFIRWLAYGHLSVRTPLDWAIAALVILLPLTLLVTPDPAETRTQVLRLLTGIGLYYAVVNWANSARRVSILFILTVAGAAVIACATPFVLSGAPSKVSLVPSVLYARQPILVSETINFNVMAGLIVVFLPVPMAVALFSPSSSGNGRRVVTGCVTLLVALILFWTQSRGAWIAAAVTVLVLISLRWRWGWLGVPLVVLAAVVLLRVPGIAALLNPFSVEGPGSSVGDRIAIWSRAVGMIRDFPLTGVGLGAFGHVADVLYPFFVVPSPFPHAHNIYLQIAVDLGLPGLLVWLIIVFFVSRSAWRLYVYGHQRNHAVAVLYGAAMLGSLVALLVHGLTDAVTWGMVRTAVVIWGLWGMTIAAQRVYAGHPALASDPVAAVISQSQTMPMVTPHLSSSGDKTP